MPQKFVFDRIDVLIFLASLSDLSLTVATSYQVGTTALPYYNLTYLVQRSVEIGKPIIGTSINYRKGGWGMLYSQEIQVTGKTNLSWRNRV